MLIYLYKHSPDLQVVTTCLAPKGFRQRIVARGLKRLCTTDIYICIDATCITYWMDVDGCILPTLTPLMCMRFTKLIESMVLNFVHNIQYPLNLSSSFGCINSKCDHHRFKTSLSKRLFL